MTVPMRRMRACLPVLVVANMVTAADAQTHARQPRQAPAPAAKSTAPPQTTFPIESLKVEGNRNYSQEQVLAVAGIKVGQPAAKPDFEAAHDRLMATGAFDTVGYRYVPAKDGKGYDATFEVAEMNQMYPLRFEDLPATDAQLREWLKQKDPLFGPKIPATQPELDRYAKWVAEFLAQQNYHEPVIGKLSPSVPPDLVIIFRPAAPHPSVAKVTFANTGSIPAPVLQKEMYGVAIGSIYTEPQFRTLLDTTIRPLYEALGRVRVSFPKLTTEDDKEVKGVVVTVQVEEGPVYKLGKVNFAGARAPQQPYEKLAKLPEGEPVNFDEVKAAQKRIEESFRHTGYLQAQSEVKRNVHDAEKTVDLTYQISPGPQFTFGQLTIVGLDLVSEPVIRKMWGLQPGRPFNPEYPNHFLDRVREEGVFDNLKATRSESKTNLEQRTVDVTLYFNK